MLAMLSGHWQCRAVGSCLLVMQLADIWSAAGHAVHKDVCMECWLLPCTLSAELQQETPLVEEQRKLQMLHKAARKIQRWWRTKKMMMYLRETGMICPGASRALASLKICLWSSRQRMARHLCHFR